MATQAYWNWVNDGRPWKVAAPVKQFGDRLRAYGYTVYYLGSDDASHLQAANPQDHCPFSFTGWPVAHPYPYVTACDVMPAPGLPSLQQLGAQIVADRNNGVPGTEWLKYMNWEPDADWSGRCWQDSWKPSHSRTNSSDRGHIHASGRSDKVTSPGPVYDPVARIRGTSSPQEDALMALPDIDAQALIWRVDALLRNLPKVEGGPTAGQPNKLYEALAELTARPQVQAAPLDAATLKAVLLDPDVRAVLAAAAREGAEAAEDS